MIKLSTTPLKRYYFVKNGVVFEIKSTYNGTDECAILCGPDNNTNYLPSLTVTENEITTVYYLDNLIQDGDLYNYNGPKFIKTVHKHSGEEASETFANYYKSLCEEKIEESLLYYFNKDYDWFNKNINKLGVPNYMIKTDGITVNSNEGDFEPIEFTEEYFEEKRVDAIRNASLDAANNVANKYQYRVDEENFQIIKINN